MHLFKKQAIEAPKTIDVEKSSESEISDFLLNKPPSHEVNLFSLIGHHWVADKDLLKRASLVFESLGQEYKLLFNAIFWNKERFMKFCVNPSSRSGHHSYDHGNLKHTVEVCENMIMLLKDSKFASKEIGVILAMLHDAGKAEEYVLTSRGQWVISKRGALLGHKLTIIEWVVTAITEHKITLKEGHYECLLHGLSAVPNAPDWTGLRLPSTHEALLLSHADRISGTHDLYEQTADKSGFGVFHKHLNTRPFTLGGANEKGN